MPVMLAVVALAAMSIFYIYTEVKEFNQLRSEHAELKSRSEEIYARVVELSEARNLFEIKSEELVSYNRFQTSSLLVKVIGSLSQVLP
ncbi:MAG: hypothetical protein HC788_12590, partial [Sphingopyxis sp.]|nr:hypothetical protein [Sphingopyxis sp.]